MKKLFPFLILTILCKPFFAQTECTGGRYVNEIFSAVDLTSNLPYGSNKDLNNATVNLALDVYEPQGDTVSLRPLMVWAHGGSFVGGSKTGTDMVPMCQTFAKKGFVTASFDYRLGMPLFPTPPDSTDATEAVMRSVQDARAAVRWFYKSAQTGNPYRIDTNRILICGVSAGGFIALHYAYLDEESEIPAWADTTKPGLGGGLSGNTGNAGYSENVIGVVNVCGALGDTAWMHPGDEPVVSVHGTQDGTVPYGTDLIYLLGIYPILVVDGSSSVHQNANAIGLPNCFYTFYGADHVPQVGTSPSALAYMDTTVNVITEYVKGWVCPSLTSTCSMLAGTPKPMETVASIFPNPALDDVKIELKEKVSGLLNLRDITGRLVSSSTLNSTSLINLSRNGMKAGIYIFELQTADGTYAGKIIWQ